MQHPGHIVAKFGGTSMASPHEVVRHITGIYSPHVVVVSAPGRDIHDRSMSKMTDLLLGYALDPSEYSLMEIRIRLTEVANRYTILPLCLTTFVDESMDQLRRWQIDGRPVAALGEQWSAKLLACATGRTFVDSREIIRIDNGDLDITASLKNIRERLSFDEQYVIPGFYGEDADGNIATLGRGGSDITGAAVALAQRAEYHNWSDVDGFYTANPLHDPSADFIDSMSYDDAINMARNGAELLHEQASLLLRSTSIKTVMKNTFGTNSKNTIVSACLGSRQI